MATKKSASNETPSEKASTKKSASKKAPAKKANTSASRRASTKKSAKKKAPAKKSASKKAPAKKQAAKKKAPAKKSASKKAPAKKSASKKAPAKKSASKKAPAKKSPARSSGSRTSASKKASSSGGTRANGSTKRPKKSPFGKRFLNKQRDMLLAEREKYIRSATTLQAEAESLVSDREPGDVQFDEESGEGDTLAVERERDLALSAQARAAVAEIDAALERIENGTYGICVVSGLEIPAERLEAIPWAAERVEYKAGGLGRR